MFFMISMSFDTTRPISECPKDSSRCYVGSGRAQVHDTPAEEDRTAVGPGRVCCIAGAGREHCTAYQEQGR